MSRHDLLITELERAMVRVEATKPRRYWLATRADMDVIHVQYDTTVQARAAAHAFGANPPAGTRGLVFPVRIFLDRTTEVVLHDQPQGRHRAPAPNLHPKGVA